jgi:hypothetical protein
MHTVNVLSELLESACPSIKYRIRAEILGQSPASPEMHDLQSQILQDPVVQEVLDSSRMAGWRGIFTG